MKINSKQFVWAFLFKNKHVGTPSYYGTIDINVKGIKNEEELYTFYMSNVESIGIDWKKTGDVKSDRQSFFAGTFNESDYEECLIGKLYLKDGSEQDWAVIAELREVVFQVSEIIDYIANSKLFDGCE